MAVEQPSPRTRTFCRTNAAKSLDPSEKGALHYFLGLTLCKLFAEKLLNAPWLLHLDVFWARLNPTLLKGRSRPDLVGRTLDGNWIAMESKGRVSKPSAEDRRKAKKQARRIVAVRGVPVRWRIGGFAFFHDDVLKFTWRDPQPEQKEPHDAVNLDITEDEIWRKYYEPLLQLVGRNRAELMLRNTEPVRLEEADFSIRIELPVLKFLLAEQWSEAGRWCIEHHQQLPTREARGDGIRIIAGESWSRPHEDIEE